MSEVLVMTGVAKAYGKHPVLRSVDLRARAGEVLGFVGPNGAGKSTCLRLILGLAFRDRGTIEVCGEDPERDGIAVRRRCTYLPGETSLYPSLTGDLLLRFALAGYAKHNAELAARLRAAFALPLDRPVRVYSAGMKQQLALLCALTPAVDLYLLDEPERNLDPDARATMRAAVAELRAAGRAILLCSHDRSEIASAADRVVALRDGVLVEEPRP